MDELVLERKDGWPNALSHVCLVCAVALLFWGLSLPGQHLQHRVVAISWLGLGSFAFLRTYRRGTTIDRRTRTLRRWWGMRMPLVTTVPLRYWGERSLQGFRQVRVCRTTRFDTWKTWRHNMLHVQVERPDDRLGPDLPFRIRVMVDDEFTSEAEAIKTASRVAEFLSIEQLPTEVGASDAVSKTPV